MPQCLAFDIGHRVEQHAGGNARIEERQDVRVGQAGGDLDFAEKPLGAQRMGEIGAQDLQGHQALVLVIARQVHNRHSPAAELSLQSVATTEGVREAGLKVVHGH